MQIPPIAYGTWVQEDTFDISNKILKAVELGYIHIDMAVSYNTEQYVVKLIKEHNISRDTIFLTSKIEFPNVTTIDICNFSDEIKSLRSNLETLKYYNLILLHHPPLNSKYREEFKIELLPLWMKMDLLVKMGIAKTIGVSNFYRNHLDILLEICNENSLTLPSINQIEVHLGNLELDYIPYLQNKNITPFAHSPLGGLGSKYILNNEILITISEKLKITPAQIILAYLLKRGIGVVTSSNNPLHMKDSFDAAKFISYITNDDIKAINSTENNLGPMICGAATAWEHNNLLY